MLVKKQTLFERVGGEKTIRELIHEFYDRVLIDTLRDCGINEQDVQDIIGRINTYADKITGDVGSAG